MQHKSYCLQVNRQEETVYRFIEEFWPNCYESHYSGGYLRVFEDYSLMKGNNIMVCIRVDTSRTEQGELDIEIIAGGARTGLIFDIGMGSEGRRIKKFEKELLSFCREKGINLEILNEG